MKEIQVVAKLYKFEELNEDAKAKAIEEERDFLLDVTQPEMFDDYEMYVKTYEWYRDEDEGVIDCLKDSEYYYHESGKLAETYYSHEGGKTKCLFCFGGMEYLLEEIEEK